MIYEMLHTGAENAIKSKVLIDILGIPARDFYAIVESERRAGKPICATKTPPAGFYRPATKEEAAEYVSMIEHTAQSMRKTARAIRKGAAGLPSEE